MCTLYTACTVYTYVCTCMYVVHCVNVYFVHISTVCICLLCMDILHAIHVCMYTLYLSVRGRLYVGNIMYAYVYTVLMSATLQLHLLLAHSHLDHLSSHLRPHLLQKSGVGGALNPSLLLLNNTGVLVGGVLERMVEVRPPLNKEPTPEGTAGGYTQQRVDLTDCIHVKCPYNGAGT